MALQVSQQEAIDLLVRLGLDKRSQADLLGGINQAKTALKDVASTSEQLNKKLADVARVEKINALGASFGKLAKDMKDADGAAALLAARLEKMGATSGEISQAAQGFANAQSAASGAGAVSGGINLTAIGSRIRSLPSTPIPGAGGLATDAVGNILRVLGALPPAALPVIAVLGGVALGFVAVNKSLEEAKRALENARKANQDYYDAIGQGTTTEDAKKRIEELNRLIGAQADATANASRATDTAFAAAQKTYGDAAARILFAVGGLSGTSEEAQKKLDALKSELEGLQRAVDENALAAADLAEREKELAAARDKHIDEQVQRDIEAARLMRSGTEEQVRDRITSLEEENAAYLKGINTIGVSTEKAEQLFQAFDKNNGTIEQLKNNVLDLAIAHDREKEAAQAAAEATKTLDKTNADIDKAIAKRQDDIAAINARYAESLKKLGEGYKQSNIEAGIQAAQKNAETERKRRDDDFKAREEYEYKLQEIEQDAADEEVKARIKRNQRLEEIEREFSASAIEAIQNRNAVALDAAERKRNEERAKADTTLQDDIEQVKDNAKKRQAELQRDFEHQARQTAIARRNQDRERDIALRNDSAARLRKYEYDKQQLAAAQVNDIAQRKAAYVKQLTDLSEFLSTSIKTQQGFYGAVLAYAIDTKNRLNGILGTGGSSTGGGGFIPTAEKKSFPGRYVPTFDSGGYVNRAGMAMLHAGEVILNRQQQKQGFGGVNITINGVGQSKANLIKEVVTQLDLMLTRAGA